MSASTSIIQKKPISIWLILSFVVAAVGIYGMIQVFMHGQEHSYGISREVPWGILIIAYSFLVAISVGTAIIGSLAHVFKIEAFHIISKKVALISLASLVGAFYLIFWELAGPFELQALRLVMYFTEFEITSPIWWMVTFYMLELPLLALEVYFLLSKKANSAFMAALVGFFLGIIAYGTLAFVFASNATRPLWHTSSFSIFFIISAIASGVAVVLMMIYFDKKANTNEKAISALGKTLFILLFMMLFINVWTVLISTYGVDTELSATIKLFVGDGVLANNFYIYELGLGIVVPMLILAISRFKCSLLAAIAGLLAVVGVFFSRFDTIIGGQLLSRPSSQMDFVQHTYNVSLSELLLFISGIGVVGIVYFLGEKFFNLEEETH
ncbi:MAG: NrfD/PsrC family molybdoenzyme membrane anchor subunit [Campylobacterota bacterium]|nr:NrfD/PsrC family molybdoenzyme membrane anchor subunit [Campylobacterota bacterium]